MKEGKEGGRDGRKEGEGGKGEGEEGGGVETVSWRRRRSDSRAIEVGVNSWLGCFFF